MKSVADFPCLWLAPDTLPGPAPLRMANVFPQAIRVHPDDIKAQISALERMKGDRVVVITKDILPFAILPLLHPDPLLLESDIPIAYLSRNSVTAEYLETPTPTLWSRKFLISMHRNREIVAPKPAVVPICAADFRLDHDEFATFLAAYRSLMELSGEYPPSETQKKSASVRASLGADTRFGNWWIMGACYALLQQNGAEEAFSSERHLMADTEGASRRVRDLTRQVRLEKGVNVTALSPAESRFFKQTCFRMPQRNTYMNLAEVYASMGKIGRKKAEQYRQAADWVWGRNH